MSVASVLPRTASIRTGSFSTGHAGGSASSASSPPVDASGSSSPPSATCQSLAASAPDARAAIHTTSSGPRVSVERGTERVACELEPVAYTRASLAVPRAERP